MEKRLPLALFLTFLVFMAWSILNPPPPKPAETGEGGAPAAGEAPQPGQAEAAPLPPPLVEPVEEVEERSLVLELGRPGEPGHYRATFTNRGALLTELRLGDYYDRGDLSEEEQRDVAHWVELLTPFETSAGKLGSFALAANQSAQELLRGTPLEQALWRVEERTEEGGARVVAFSYDPGSGVLFHKRFRFVPGSYAIELELALENRASDLGGERQFVLTPAAVIGRSAADTFYVEPTAVAAWKGDDRELSLKNQPRKEKPGSEPIGSLTASGAFSFGGVHSKYFALLLHPDPSDAQAARVVRGARYLCLRDAEWVRANPGAGGEGGWTQIACQLDLALFLPEKGRSFARRFQIYAGPKQHAALVESWRDHQALIDEDLGMFSSVSKVILGILGLYEGLVGNWGWAIILMTLTVRLLLFPLNRRMQTSMARYQTKMKRIQPKLDEVKKRYEKDPQKLRQEQAKIMQEEGAFPPLGGCLPVFLQMPIFIGLFQALRVDFDLRQAPFMLWIGDLSMPDQLLTLGLHLPILGGMFEHLNVLPILMIVLWILQQRSMPTPTDEQQARMQKMMMWMPILFGFFLYNYAAGLSLYMITSSGLGIFETRVIKKLWPVDDKEKPKKKSGFMARLAELQKEQERRMRTQQQPRKPGGGGKGRKGKR